MTYTLFIMGSRREYHDFDTEQELIDALLYRGLPVELADFKCATWDKFGMAKNNYRHYSVTAYK